MMSTGPHAPGHDESAAILDPGTAPRRDRDRLDLHELAGIPEDGNTKQRARRVMICERRPDDLPGGHQITAIA
jgi:hypothetical protein